jgi:DNA-binding transcriptional MerR regulator
LDFRSGATTGFSMYSIKAVSHATGLTVETLRAWERRYGVIRPQRDATGRRVYAASDVARLRRLREATERGHPISRIASLTDIELARLLSDVPERQNRAAANAFVRRMVDAAANFKPIDCEQALTLAISLLPAAQLVEEVLEPVLREVGERWHSGEFSIAQERLVSACVRRQVALVLDSYERLARGPAIVFATLPGERHELGLLMSALIAATRGLRCHYLGPDLPASDLVHYVLRVDAAVAAISVVLGANLRVLHDDLDTLATGLGPSRQVWIGGASAAGLSRLELPRGCVVIDDRAGFEQHLDLLADARI